MAITKTDDFLKAFVRLPHEAQRLFKIQEAIFAKNWFDSRLHVKRLKELNGVYSFRVTRVYRVLFYLRDSGTAVFFAIGHRKEIYR